MSEGKWEGMEKMSEVWPFLYMWKVVGCVMVCLAVFAYLGKFCIWFFGVLFMAGWFLLET
jgi:hypothetical protein